MSITAAELLAELPETGEAIPLPVIAKRIGWNKVQQHYAIQAGVIRPLEKRGPHGAFQVDRDQAVGILIAYAVALAAGLAVVTILRGLQGAKLDVSALARAVT